MIARHTLCALALGLLATFPGNVCAAPYSRAYPSKPHPAVCRIAVAERGGQAFGSGTLIDTRERYGLVVTNWHVVRDATGKIEVRFPSGYVSEARPVKLDETWDLAALVIWRPPAEPAPLAKSPPKPGEPLTICGYGGGDYLQQTGRCTDYYSPEIGQPQELVELNVEARQGDSGGPIFNARGELAGVLFGAAQGTTLGSFEGRVKTFLATLAPDIGISQPKTLFANTPPSRRRQPTDSRPVRSPPTRVGGSDPTAVDPFLAAERASLAVEPSKRLAVSAAPSGGLPAAAVTRRTADPSMPPPSLADRSSSPRLTKERQPASGWFAPGGAGGSIAFTPQTSSPPAATPGVDWYDDGRTVLAVLGAAALAVSAIRAVA
ncbi:Serine protease [Planctomycetes bacterium MalM25]|nr:Serine protease [Planctomycetes bacterium MalM25]